MSDTDLRGLVARPGANDVSYDNPHYPGHPVVLRSACPSAYSVHTPVLFVHHGDLRNGAEFRDYWLPLVDQLQLLVIAPEFSLENYPGSAAYASGNVLDVAGQRRPRAQWT